MECFIFIFRLLIFIYHEFSYIEEQKIIPKVYVTLHVYQRIINDVFFIL